MAYDYGYGDLGNKLIELFRSGAPDFDTAEELIKQGANLNAIGKDDEENILSVILSGYWWSVYGESTRSTCDDCSDTHCEDCKQNRNLTSTLGKSMCAIIRFFLEHGFDVTTLDGCFGAQCLWALTLSTFDWYMIEATKLLLDAGAKNRTISLRSSEDDETPWDFIGTEGSYQDSFVHNHALANIYEAIYQIYQAIEDGRPYSGIDSYEIAVGKRVEKVLAERNGDHPIFFPMDFPKFKKDNCYTQTLYFVYDDGVLITTQFADFWTDTVLPNSDLVDVSEHFDGIVGKTIQSFTYDHKSVIKDRVHCGQPITTIQMDSGHKIRFSINFGEVSDEDRAAYFELFK